jgi:hypothetical protein
VILIAVALVALILAFGALPLLFGYLARRLWERATAPPRKKPLDRDKRG